VRTQICRPNPRWKNTLEGAAVNAGEALKTTRVAGVELRLDGDNLVLEASAPPPVAILDLLSGYKPSIVELLRPGLDSWSAEDWQAIFDERAGIAEFARGLRTANPSFRSRRSRVSTLL